jgi:hypothetical protein
MSQAGIRSVFDGEIANTAESLTLTLGRSNSWSVTADSILTALTDADTSLSNINSNGHTVTYDSTTSANSWLIGKTIALKRRRASGACFLIYSLKRRPISQYDVSG